jgi:hypothetical protein
MFLHMPLTMPGTHAGPRTAGAAGVGVAVRQGPVAGAVTVLQDPYPGILEDHFPNQRALLLAAHPEIERGSLLPDDPPADVADRLDQVMRA